MIFKSFIIHGETIFNLEINSNRKRLNVYHKFVYSLLCWAPPTASSIQTLLRERILGGWWWEGNEDLKAISTVEWVIRSGTEHNDNEY